MSEELKHALATISPGPYQWGIFKEAAAAQMATENLAKGSGDVHLVIMPEHPKAIAGPDELHPQEAITFCMTGNGPNSEANAKALCVILTALPAIELELARLLRIVEAAEKMDYAIGQASGSMQIDAMVDDKGEFFGTTKVAFAAMKEAKAAYDAAKAQPTQQGEKKE